MEQHELKQIAETVGKEYGYETIDAEFSAFADFKVRWERGSKWISIMVSDYLSEAPSDIIEQLMVTIFRKIRGEQVGYPQDVKTYLDSEDFLGTAIPLYRHRKCLEGMPDGMSGYVAEVFEDPSIVMAARRRKGSHVSPMFRTVIVGKDALERFEEDRVGFVEHLEQLREDYEIAKACLATRRGA